MSTSVNHVLWQSDEVTRAVKGVSTGPNWQATGVSIDSRTVVSGDLFIAISGPNFDGHDFIEMAFENGAVAAIVNHKIEADGPVVIVENTDLALYDLAHAARSRTAAKIIAVTGSVGKTGTKEALRTVLSHQGKVEATQGNLNNNWGLPLSLARMPADTEFGIFEIGMNHAGEIKPLSILARPDVSVITTVAAVHSEYFKSTEDIADAKAEIFEGMKENGTVILNIDNEFYNRLAGAASRKAINSTFSFGVQEKADIRLLTVRPMQEGSHITATFLGKHIDYKIGVSGHHWAQNSLAVLAAVHAVGADVAAAAASMVELKGLKGRGQRHRLPVGDGHYILIDESYNASPVSMRAAIDVLGQFPMVKNDNGTGRKIAILGDMLELGESAEAEHANLRDWLVLQKIELVLTAGQYMEVLSHVLPPEIRGGHAMSAAKLIPALKETIQAGDVVMVKGSLGSHVSDIVTFLVNDGS